MAHVSPSDPPSPTPAASRPRTARRPRYLLALAAGALAIWGVALVSSAGADQREHKVTLCHATASHTNPYVVVTVDYHSVVNGGHGTHDGPVFSPDLEGRWGDIIPAFDLGGVQYPGMNLDGGGQAILDDSCAVVPATTTTTAIG